MVKVLPVVVLSVPGFTGDTQLHSFHQKEKCIFFHGHMCIEVHMNDAHVWYKCLLVYAL